MWVSKMNTVQAIAAIIIIAGGILFTAVPLSGIFMPFLKFIIPLSIMLVGMLLCLIGFVILLASVIKERLEDIKEEKL